ASPTISVSSKVLAEKKAGRPHDAQENTCRHRPGEVMAMIDVLIHFFGSKVDFILEMFCRCKRYVRYFEVVYITVSR
ncbi:MAG: hypothetical protein WAU18_02980, partial [Trichococcus flocculiformis]